MLQLIFFICFKHFIRLSSFQNMISSKIKCLMSLLILSTSIFSNLGNLAHIQAMSWTCNSFKLLEYLWISSKSSLEQLIEFIGSRQLLSFSNDPKIVIIVLISSIEISKVLNSIHFSLSKLLLIFSSVASFRVRKWCYVSILFKKINYLSATQNFCCYTK